ASCATTRRPPVPSRVCRNGRGRGPPRPPGQAWTRSLREGYRRPSGHRAGLERGTWSQAVRAPQGAATQGVGESADAVGDVGQAERPANAVRTLTDTRRGGRRIFPLGCLAHGRIAATPVVPDSIAALAVRYREGARRVVAAIAATY